MCVKRGGGGLDASVSPMIQTCFPSLLHNTRQFTSKDTFLGGPNLARTIGMHPPSCRIQKQSAGSPWAHRLCPGATLTGFIHDASSSCRQQRNKVCQLSQFAHWTASSQKASHRLPPQIRQAPPAAHPISRVFPWSGIGCIGAASVPEKGSKNKTQAPKTVPNLKWNKSANRGAQRTLPHELTATISLASRKMRPNHKRVDP
jgi:hypothetical protein